MVISRESLRLSPRLAYAAFGGFGLFWGAWGAALPGLRLQAQVTDGQLGTALLLIGAGALPLMLLTGRAFDRFGPRLAGGFIAALGLTGAIVGLFGRDAMTLSVSLLLLGAASGGTDVAINAIAGVAEHESGTPVITRSHGVFSASVVLGALLAGGFIALSLPPAALFGAVFLILGAVGAGIVTRAPGPVPNATPDDAASIAPGGGFDPEPGRGDSNDVPPAPHTRQARPMLLPFLLVGLVGALGFAVENAHQSWSAIFLGDEVGAAPALTALAPATFAVFAALARFGIGALPGLSAAWLLTGGGAVAVAGTALLAGSTTPPVAFTGLALAAVGTAVLFPTLLAESTRNTPTHHRGRATSMVATTAYLGFLLGPVFVGLLAEAFGLRIALLGVAALAAGFMVTAWPVSRAARHAPQPTPEPESQTYRASSIRP